MAPGSLLAKMLRSTQDNMGPDAPYPRVLVFAADAESADKMATALRAAVWEEYRIGLVLPGGDFPTKMLQVRFIFAPHSVQAWKTDPFSVLMCSTGYAQCTTDNTLWESVQLRLWCRILKTIRFYW